MARTITVKRKGYTRKDGTKVKGSTFKIKDRGKPGRSPNKIKLKSGGLGGEGYAEKAERTRHSLLNKSIKRDGYATTMRRITALRNLGSRTMSKKDLATLKRDQNWLRTKKPKK